MSMARSAVDDSGMLLEICEFQPIRFAYCR
jgi:hypothetical protein